MRFRSISTSFGLRGGDGEAEVALATTTHGAHWDNEDSESAGYHVAHAGLGTTHSTDPELVLACRSIGWNAKTLAERDMHVMLWRKLAVNCVINPLTAVECEERRAARSGRNEIRHRKFWKRCPSSPNWSRPRGSSTCIPTAQSARTSIG
ncbi:hypothetical protein ACHAWF_002029 [Thalassiosira exigua]